VSQLWNFSPDRRDEIVRDLRLVHSQADRIWAGFDDAAFFQPLGTGWSPAQNVVHLTKSVRPVAKALGLPKLVLALMFGRAKRGSGSYVALGDRYQGLLTAGAGAGSFTPREVPRPANPRELRGELVAGFAEAVEQLARRSDAWSETALDRYRLPHPLLGKLTVREMLFFTVLHIAHHASKVEARQAAAKSVPATDSPRACDSPGSVARSRRDRSQRPRGGNVIGKHRPFGAFPGPLERLDAVLDQRLALRR
jgi:hypothetical protein